MKVLLRLSLICLLAGSVAPAAAAPATQQNLLANPGFEGSYAKQCCHTEPQYLPNTLYDEVQVAPGWTAWWLEPGDAQHPTNCAGCNSWHRPEWREAAPFGNRIHSGSNAQKYFTFYSVHEAGMYQQVTGVIPGQRYRFSVYMQTWSTDGEELTSIVKDNDLGMKVGIDPTGGTDAFSSNIVWSAPFNAFDSWVLYAVDAVAKSSTLTVYTRSQPRWGVEHNDIYVDDASLNAVGANPPPLPTYPPAITPGPDGKSAASFATVNPPTAAALQPNTQPTAIPTQGPSLTPSWTPSPTWPPTGTPLPNNEVRYTVRQGDTLNVIAYYHNTTVDEIKRLNALNSNVIYPGQELLIGYVAPQPTATATPEFTPTPSLTPELVLLPTNTLAPISVLPDYGQLCVVAYNDANANANNDGEPALADVRITLSVGSAPLDGYVTTGTEELPHCFPQLPPGAYTVSVAVPAGYTATTTSESTVQLEAGKVITLVFGIAPATTAPFETTSWVSRAGQLLLFGGLGIVLAAMAGAAILVLARKK